MSDQFNNAFEVQSLLFTDDEGNVNFGLFAGGVLPHGAVPDAPDGSIYYRSDGSVHVLSGYGGIASNWSKEPTDVKNRLEALEALDHAALDLAPYLKKDLTLLADSIGDEQAHDWEPLFSTLGNLYVDDGFDGSGLTVGLMNMAYRDIYVVPDLSALGSLALDWTNAYEGKLGFTKDTNTYYTWYGTAWQELQVKPKSHNHDDKYSSVKPWVAMQVYALNDLAIENDKIFRSLISPNINNTPPNAAWGELSKTSEMADWVGGNSYVQGNVVTFQGAIYRATVDTVGLPPSIGNDWEVISPDTNTIYDDSALDARLDALELLPPSQTDFTKQYQIVEEQNQLSIAQNIGSQSVYVNLLTTLQEDDLVRFSFSDSGTSTSTRSWGIQSLDIRLTHSKYFIWNYNDDYIIIDFDYPNKRFRFTPQGRSVRLIGLRVVRVASLALPNLPVDIAGMQDGDLFKLDLPNKKLVKADAGGSSVFGEGFSQINEYAESTTTSTQWQTKATLSFPVKAGATYRLGWQWMWGGTNTGTDIDTRITLNGNQYLGKSQAPEDTNAEHDFCGFDYYGQSTNGTIEVKIQYKTEFSNATAKIWEARIEQFRVI